MNDEACHWLKMLINDVRRNSGYLAREEIYRLTSSIAAIDPKRLEPYGFKVYSQNDEDGIIEEIFRRLKIDQGTFCEIGIGNGLECNSLYLLHKGWRGGWIEGETSVSGFIDQKFRILLNSQQLKVSYSMVTVGNVNDLIANVSPPGELDLLSIDIDGNDIYLLQALLIQPKVICIEYNGKFRGNIHRMPSYAPDRMWDGTDYMGSSLLAIEEVARAKGYRLVGTNITGANAFFVRNDLAQNLFSHDATAENLYNPARYHFYFDHFLSIGHPAGFGEYVSRETQEWD